MADSWFDAGSDPNADPYQYADYTMPGNGGTTEHQYDPTTGDEHVYFTWDNGDPWAPTPSGHPTSDAYFVPEQPLSPYAPPPPSVPNVSGAPSVPTRSAAPTPPNPSNFPSAQLPTLRPPPPAFKAPDPLAPWTGSFTAPTAEAAASEPGFQFQLGEALKAIERSAAAKGTLLTGGTGKALEGRAVDLANTNYKDVYGRAYNEYDTRRSDFLNNEANRFTSQVSNENNRYDSEFANWQGQYGQEAGLFGMADQNRMHDWGINSDYFNMGRANRLDDWGMDVDIYGMNRNNRLDDFSMWNTNDTSSFNKLLALANLRKPVSPYAAF